MAISVETYALAKKNAKKQIEEALTSVYDYKGSVQTVADLPLTGNKVGDVYNVISEGSGNWRIEFKTVGTKTLTVKKAFNAGFCNRGNLFI